jgi:hypothetical protein
MTYEEATAFREAANVPLEWEETSGFPTPPLDRVEFTRRIVTVMAEQKKKTFDSWKTPLVYEDIDSSDWAELSNSVHFFIHLHVFYKLAKSHPEKDNSHKNIKEIFIRYYPKYIGEMITVLEDAYLEKWERTYKYGASENARKNVLEAIYETVKEYPSKKSDALTEGTIMSECCSHPVIFADTKFWRVMDYFDMSNIQRTQETHKEIETVEIRFFGFLPHYALYPVVLLCATLLTLLYTGYFGAGWRLAWFIPFSLFVSFMACARTISIRWKHPNKTLGELADKIVALHYDSHLRMKGNNSLAS